MSSNVGLSTPRGSGTSGYVQRNAATIKPRSTGVGQPYSTEARHLKVRKPDEDILKHNRLREIEVEVARLQDKLEEAGEMDDEEIEVECDKERKRLVQERERKGGRQKGSQHDDQRKAKSYQVHELAEAKEKESERLRRALGLRGDRNGDEHPMERDKKNRTGYADRKEHSGKVHGESTVGDQD